MNKKLLYLNLIAFVLQYLINSVNLSLNLQEYVLLQTKKNVEILYIVFVGVDC